MALGVVPTLKQRPLNMSILKILEKEKITCEVCGQRGICCTVTVYWKQHGLNFICKEPFFICEKLDQQTGKCTDYENRPEACKEYDCRGKPHSMVRMIEGKSNKE